RASCRRAGAVARRASAARSYSLCLKHLGGEVSLARVAKYGEDDLTRTDPLGDPQSGAAIGTGRDAEQHTFFTREAPREVRGVFVAHGQNFVDDLRVEVLGDESRPDSLDLVVAGFST